MPSKKRKDKAIVDVADGYVNRNRGVRRIAGHSLTGPWRWDFEEVAFKTAHQVKAGIASAKASREVTVRFTDRGKRWLVTALVTQIENKIGGIRFWLIGMDAPRPSALRL